MEDDKIIKPAKITIEMHGITRTVDGLPWDSSYSELLREFKALLIGVGFSKDIINEDEE